MITLGLVFVASVSCCLFRLLGVLLARVFDNTAIVSGEQKSLELLSQLFIFYLDSRSALQKSCTAYVISEWAAALKVHCSMDLPVIHCIHFFKLFKIIFTVVI